ncbi:MAG: hypothetical protein JO297_03420 [Nitrososphaeraceae archaeon]|nr:hypothetical protein [Nitrososphaeraceae archaeon]
MEVGRAYNLTKTQTKMIFVEEEYRTRPEGSEGNEGIRESHVDVNYDITQKIIVLFHKEIKHKESMK